MAATTHRDLMDGRVVRQGENYIVILKEGRHFMIEFGSHVLREIKKQQ